MAFSCGNTDRKTVDGCNSIPHGLLIVWSTRPAVILWGFIEGVVIFGGMGYAVGA